MTLMLKVETCDVVQLLQRFEIWRITIPAQ